MVDLSWLTPEKARKLLRLIYDRMEAWTEKRNAWREHVRQGRKWRRNRTGRTIPLDPQTITRGRKKRPPRRPDDEILAEFGPLPPIGRKVSLTPELRERFFRKGPKRRGGRVSS